MALIDDVAKRALSGECDISIPAPNRHLAYRIYQAASPHMEERGARERKDSLSWEFHNGSRVRIAVAA